MSVDLAGEFARLLGAELELVVVDAAGSLVDVAASEQAGIGFFAIDPVRGANIAFSAAGTDPALAGFVERMKASGFVADALARHRVEGASVAPAR